MVAGHQEVLGRELRMMHMQEMCSTTYLPASDFFFSVSEISQVIIVFFKSYF